MTLRPPRVGRPEANVLARQAVPPEQRIDGALDHPRRQVANRGVKNDPQLPLALTEADLVLLVRIQKRLDIDDRRQGRAALATFGAQDEGRGAIGADRIAHHGLQAAVDVIARRTDFHGQHQGPPSGMRARA